MPGLFLALDGLDGTGKSTQCRLLAEWFRERGRTVVTCVDPGGTAVGDQLRRLIFHSERPLALPCEALLFMASRAQLVQEVIGPALAASNIVVTDRFLLANIVYQGHAGGLAVEQLRQLGSFATGGLEPDLTVVLDVQLEVARARRGRPADRIEGRDEAYQMRVREGFLVEARRCSERIAVIDAAGPLPTVQSAIRAALAQRFPDVV